MAFIKYKNEVPNKNVKISIQHFRQYILYPIQEKYLYNGRENKTVIYNLPKIVEDSILISINSFRASIFA